ncbi:uncharacterized protein EHS24_006904 [Apiotrichum porosum]|uniref:Uncharacterized protein n=1 Tax=Apiotrichum porosum TaxID=105984 RepID=A0A427XWR3_9TREE|nr:uncharacterized protein EHS24_006904 [Apiotrichum porosum]RSH83237.1 hypothetical protein EHS24_006904 [Apiotrichum porosum]
MLVVSRLFQEYWLPLHQCDDDIDTRIIFYLPDPIGFDLVACVMEEVGDYLDDKGVEDYDFEPVQDTDGEMAFHLLVNRVWLGGIEDEVWDILHGLIPDFDGTGVEIVSL